MQSLLTVIATLIAIQSAKTFNYTLNVNTTNIIQHMSGSLPFYGFTIDFWNNNQSKWTPNAGILSLNLSNANLITLTKELSPAMLRVGGSPQDSVVYDINGECSKKYGFPGYDCSQTVNNGYYGCINKTRWNQINEFAINTNVTLIFGLNACYGRKSRTSSMNFSNIISLINYTNTMGNKAANLLGFEFGNELQSKPKNSNNPRVDATTYGQDFYKLYQIVDNKYKILGNDGASPGYSAQFISSLNNSASKHGQQAKDILYRLTYHHYAQCNYPNGTLVFSLECLSDIIRFTSVFNAVTVPNGIIPVMGEGAEHTGGGTADVTNTFVDNFYYVYQLCTVLQYGINSTWRSDLIGGDYELIDHKTFEPNPDYWILYIWKQLIGDALYFSDLKGSPNNTRAFAFRGKESQDLVLVFINFDMKNSAQFNIKIDDGTKQYNSEEYHIAPDPNEKSLQTRMIYVNDVVMQYKNGQFPTLQPVKGNGETVMLSPARIAFVVLKPQ